MRYISDFSFETILIINGNICEIVACINIKKKCLLELIIELSSCLKE